MERPWCQCNNNGECRGCMIEERLGNPDSLREMITQYYFGTAGLDYYRNHMSDRIFMMENPELFKKDE